MVSLKGQLVNYLFKMYPRWIHKGEIEEMIWRNQRNGTRYMPSSVSRQLVKAENEMLVATKPSTNKGSEFKWIPSELRDKYIRTVFRQKGKETILFKP